MRFPNFIGRSIIACTALAGAALLVAPSASMAQGINLADCKGLWFSTSEDFLSRGTRLPGGPVVSDGDLLTFEVGSGSRLCARNADLLRVFDIERYDHGLDAVEQITIDDGAVFIAFSTEIDSVNGAGQFTAGDLLFGNGAVVPNNALLVKFDLPRSLNLGLDAVHIEGAPREKRDLMAKLSSTSVDELRQNPGLLIDILDGTNTDILFSTEGTPPDVQQPQFLDGDLLSAKNGTIVRSNNSLLPALPSGLPAEGVDYGLDAYTPAIDPIEQVPIELLSIEIQAREGSISDGDALTVGPGVYLRNKDLIASFEPRDTDMGLDALAAGTVVQGCNFYINKISDIDVVDINQITGLFGDQRPFGRDISIDGVLPGSACPEYTTHEFQVRVAVNGGPELPINHAGMNWMRDVGPTCNDNDLYAEDISGWIALTDYWRFAECPDHGYLAAWRSATVAGAQTAVFRVVMREIGTAVETFSAPVRIRVDNEKPNPVDMALFLPGSPPVQFDDQCKIDGMGNDVIIDIRGEIFDEHFSHYTLSWNGNGNVGGPVPATLIQSWPPGSASLNDTGTQPPATDVALGTLNLTQQWDLELDGIDNDDPLPECGFSIRLVAWDRTRNGNFKFAQNDWDLTNSNWEDYQQSFCLVP
ncbi:hypothetical protein [Ruegeria sp. HKCCD8929]|uniref:hypothetical protein n=1 Tax=Ruegeria sp. HKCCD8929 TaxID=2683006 RepID=UPI00148773AD|nr:hypothetical protein [Ruegeria sp. HKCCD8929]